MKLRFTTSLVVIAVFLLLVLPSGAKAQDENPLTRMQETISDFELDNGMRFIICNRPEVPVARFIIHVDVGSSSEHWGITGMAHMFEHMAFKGTESIGTTDIEAEQQALAELDTAFDALRKERQRQPAPDAEKEKELFAAFQAAQDKAASFVVQNEYTEIYGRAGESGLNAFTSADATVYMVALPSNKTELWFAMESERFLFPVLREFFKERNVVKEERRMRTDNQPIGKLIEDMTATAFRVHPYGSPPIGYYSDLNSFTRDEAKIFFETYYTASNMVVAIVGDVDPAEAKRLAEKYFGRLPKRPKPERVESVEPEPTGEHRIIHNTKVQPLIAMSYMGTSYTDKDNTTLEVLGQILSGGRTSRMYRILVEEKKLAIQAGAFPGLPGDKYKGQFVVYAMNGVDVDTGNLEAEIEAIIKDVQENGVTQEELDRVKNSSYASFIRGLQSGQGLALQLTKAQHLAGDWRYAFKAVDRINSVTLEDIQRVAKTYLQPERRVVGTLRTETPSE